MAQTKKHYKVDVYIYGESACTPFRTLYKTIETWAVSSDKAESNARYRNEGRAFWNEEHGSDGNWSAYDYQARLI